MAGDAGGAALRIPSGQGRRPRPLRGTGGIAPASLASLAPGTCVVVNYIDAATPAVLAELAEAARRVAVVGCGPELPEGHDPAAWSVVRSTEEWRPLFERDEPPSLSIDAG